MTNDIRICFFGESYLQGFGDTTGQGLPGRLTAHEAAHGRMVTAYNMAIRGETVRDLARRWPAELAPRLATMPRSDAALGLVFLFGTNDVSDNGLAQGLDLAAALDLAARLMAGVQGCWPVLWLSTPPPGGSGLDSRRVAIRALVDGHRRIAGRLAIPFIDLWPALAGDAWRQAVADGPDGVHPAAAGHRLMAGAVVRHAAWPTFVSALESVCAGTASTTGPCATGPVATGPRATNPRATNSRATPVASAAAGPILTSHSGSSS